MFLIQKSKLQISSDPIVMICAALCITAVYTATATWMFLGVTGLSAIGYFGWKAGLQSKNVGITQSKTSSHPNRK